MRRRWIAAAGLVLGAAAGWIAFWDDSSSPATAVLGGYRDRWFVVVVLLTWAALVALFAACVRPARRTLFRIGAVHLGVCLAFALVELTALAGWMDYSTLFAPNRMTAPSRDPRLRWQRAPHEHFAGDVLPDLVRVLGATAEPIAVDYRTDRYGLRNPRDKDDPAVLFLGDSLLVAGLVPVERTVTERVEAGLGASVLNISESGYAPQEELARLDVTGIDLRGRLVVQFFFAGNDLQDSASWRAWRERRLSSDWPRTGFVKAALNALHRPRRAAGSRRTGWFRGRDGEPTLIHFLYEDAGWKPYAGELDVLRDAYRAAKRDIEARGGRYAMAFIPIKLAVLRSSCTFPADGAIAGIAADRSLAESLAAFCAQEGIPFLDLQPALTRLAASGILPYFAADTHLNEAGQAAMAEALVPWLRELLPQPP